MWTAYRVVPSLADHCGAYNTPWQQTDAISWNHRRLLRTNGKLDNVSVWASWYSMIITFFALKSALVLVLHVLRSFFALKSDNHGKLDTRNSVSTHASWEFHYQSEHRGRTRQKAEGKNTITGMRSETINCLYGCHKRAPKNRKWLCGRCTLKNKYNAEKYGRQLQLTTLGNSFAGFNANNTKMTPEKLYIRIHARFSSKTRKRFVTSA